MPAVLIIRVRGQAFNADGDPIGDEQLISSHSSGEIAEISADVGRAAGREDTSSYGRAAIPKATMSTSGPGESGPTEHLWMNRLWSIQPLT